MTPTPEEVLAALLAWLDVDEMNRPSTHGKLIRVAADALAASQERVRELEKLMSRKDEDDLFYYCAICRGMGDDNLGPETINHLYDCEWLALRGPESPA